MIVGLTGGIGSGKSTVAQFFRECLVKVIDSDTITRELMRPGTKAFNSIVEYFGPSILTNNNIDRALLRARVFQNPKERKMLENILHPEVKLEIAKQAAMPDAKPYVVVEVPLLIEAEFQDAVDRILVIDCSLIKQIKRVAKRDGISEEEIKSIIQTQVSRDKRREQADDVIENEGSLEELKKKVSILHRQYIELAK